MNVMFTCSQLYLLKMFYLNTESEDSELLSTKLDDSHTINSVNNSKLSVLINSKLYRSSLLTKAT